MVAHERVGLKVVSELATRTHASGGKTWVRYAMAARHSGSIDGREKAGPQMWSSRTIAVCSHSSPSGDRLPYPNFLVPGSHEFGETFFLD